MYQAGQALLSSLDYFTDASYSLQVFPSVWMFNVVGGWFLIDLLCTNQPSTVLKIAMEGKNIKAYHQQHI